MKAAVYTGHGSTDVLEVREMDQPDYGSNDVLIDVKSFALNRLDVWTRKGMPSLDIDFPHIGGSDFSGIVVEVGEHVTHINEGTRVVVNPGISCGTCHQCRKGEISLCTEYHLLGEHVNGGAAEFAVAPAQNISLLPENIDHTDAAAMALTGMTAYRMIKTRANIRPGENILVVGAGGGVGTAAVQLSYELGGRVIALTSSEQKMRKSKELGASHSINYREDEDWSRIVWELTDKNGVDIVLDSTGQAVFSQSIRSLAKGGRYVTVGATSGTKGEFNIARLFWRQLSILGSTMASRQEFDEVMKLFYDGRISPVIDSIYSLDEIEEAHKRQEDPDHMGKIVIEL